MIEKLKTIKKLLDEKKFSTIIDIYSELYSISPVYNEDINSIKKAISNYDFGNCKIFIETLLSKINSIENKNIFEADNTIDLNHLTSIGAIGAIENSGLTPKNDEEWSVYNNNEAKMYEKIGDYNKAVLHYKKSLTSNRKNLNALTNLNSIYVKFGKFEEGLSILNLHIPFIENLNDRLYLKFSKANMERSLNMYENSIKTIDEIINENIKDDLYYESLLFRGVTKVSLNIIESAMDDLTMVKSHSPENFYKNADALMIFGAFNNNISFDDKIKHLKKSIEILPKWEFSHYNLAVILKREKQYMEALTAYIGAYNINKNETDYIDGIVECLYFLGNTEQLKPFLKMGIEMGSEYCKRNIDLL